MHGKGLDFMPNKTVCMCVLVLLLLLAVVVTATATLQFPQSLCRYTNSSLAFTNDYEWDFYSNGFYRSVIK